MLVVIETPSLRQRFAPILARGMLTHVPKLTQLTYLKIDQTTNCTIRAAEYGSIAASPHLRDLVILHSCTDMTPLFEALVRRAEPLRLLKLADCACVCQEQLDGLLKGMLATMPAAPPCVCTVSVDRFYNPSLASRVLQHPHVCLTIAQK